jgi:hypothetical protein
MLTIDADAHVIECEKTWDYLEGEDKRYRPVPIAVDMPSGKTQNFWIIGGRLIGGRDNIGQDTSKESREMATSIRASNIWTRSAPACRCSTRRFFSDR